MAGGEIAGHALVVGSPGENLRGVDHDVQAMAEMLRKRGFAVDIRTGDRATRAGILEGYDGLIEKVRVDEPAVFYYSGHGFHAVVDNERKRAWQGISPTDQGASTTTDFRGITSWELSIKQAQLTERTKNVTVILDCCYASQMSRDGAARDAVPRALPHPFRLGFDAHLRALRATYGTAFGAIGPRGNRDAVRLVACAQDESAYEYPVDGKYRGAFTEALLDVLDEVGDASVSWAAIDDAIRGRVLGMFPIQRPDIEGPVHRRLFSLLEDRPGHGVPITATSNGCRLGAGRLMGVVPGDTYAVMPPGSRTYSAADAIAEVTITEAFATSSNTEPAGWKNGHSELPRDAVALPVEKHAARRPVTIEAPDASRERMKAEVVANPLLRPAEPGDTAALATLRLADGALTIEDRLGPLCPEARFPDGLENPVKNLANLAAAQRVRELEGEHGVLADELEIEWGALDRGELRSMPDRGGALALCDKVYVRIKSKGERPLYAHIFNLGLRGKITLLTDFAPAGVLLNRNEADFVLGRRPDGALVGLELGWPEGMPRETFPRLDEIVVIVTSAPATLRGLETVEQPVIARGAGSKLEELLAQVQNGRPRSLRSMESIDGFFMKRLSYFLHPRDAVMADIPFEVDDNPLRQAAARAPDAWIAARRDAAPAPRPPTEIAIRIADLVIGDRRALATDIRLDALVCTRAAGDARGHSTWTQKWRGARTGDRLRLDQQPVFLGPVRDFVDLYLWVSHDSEDGLDLSPLFTQRAGRAELEEAARTLSIEGGSPVPWVAATGASAVLARMAYRLLLGAADTTIGLYRTSFVADERFGAGRHVVEGTSGSSFSLLIEPIAPAGSTQPDT